MGVDDNGLEEWGPTRLIDDGSLRVLRAKSRTLDGSLPVENPAADVERKRITPRGLRYWALPVMFVGGFAAWSLLRDRDVARPQPAPEPERIVMPVVAPAPIEMPDDVIVERVTKRPKAKPASRVSPRAKRAASRRNK
jgi:hypothetical protein